jgi:hypothetical protein
MTAQSGAGDEAPSVVGLLTVSGLSVLALSVALALPATAVAQPEADPDARDVSVARTEFRAGVQAARAGDWGAARDHFARSYAINPRASALFNLAGAQLQTGQLVEAAESYREYLGRRTEATAANIAESERVLAELESRIPTVTLRVDDLADGDEVLLDDAVLNPLLLGQPMPLNPGEHRVAVRRAGDVIASETLRATEGARLEASLVAPAPPAPRPAEPEPLPAVTSPEPAETAVSPHVAASSSGSSRGAEGETDSGSVLEQWWLWTIVGVVVVGAVVGIYFAIPPSEAPPNRGFPDGPVEVR